MTPQSKGNSSKYNIEHQGRTSQREASTPILSAVKEVATLAQISELKITASVALRILIDIQTITGENKRAYERLGDDFGGLILAIWRSSKNAESLQDWLSVETKELLDDLTHTLEGIRAFVEGQLSGKKDIRAIFGRGSKDEAKKISEHHDNVNYAIKNFKRQSKMNINEVLGQLVKKSDQLSEQLSHLNDNEDHEARYWKQADDIYCEEESKTVKEIPEPRRVQHDLQAQADDERLGGHLDKLKKNQEEMIDQQSRMERHRVAVEKANLLRKAEEDEIAELRRKIADQQSRERHQVTVEKANLLKKAQEDEIAELRRKIAAGEDNQQYTTIQGQSSKKKKSQRQDKAEREDERRGNFMPMVAEENTLEGEVKQPVRRSPKVMNTPKPSRREDMDDIRSLNSKLRTTHLTPSNTSLRVEETEEESPEEESPEEESSDEEAEYEPPPPRRNPKVNRKPQSPSSASPRRDVDDQWRNQFQGFASSGMGGRSNSLPTAPTYSQPHGACLPPPMGHYVGAPGTIVNCGVGNTTNTTISNVGNNNSIEEVYYTRTRSKRRTVGY